VHAPLERRLHHRPRLRRLDPAVVDAVRKRDDVTGEAVAADVRRLPDPALFDLLPKRLVERAAPARAAAVVLPVRADEEERVVDRVAGGGEVEPDELVVPLELEPAELAPLARRRAGEDGDSLASAPLRAADEQDARVRQPAPLGREVRLDLVRERRAVDGVVRPEPPVLDQDPRVDAARRCVERLVVEAGGVRAEGLARPSRIKRRRGRSPARS
jgi:hypothetical protein